MFSQDKVFVTPSGRTKVLCPGTTSFEAFVACVHDSKLSKLDRLLHLRTAFPGEDPRVLLKRVGIAKKSVRQRGCVMRPSIVNMTPWSLSLGLLRRHVASMLLLSVLQCPWLHVSVLICVLHGLVMHVVMWNSQ